MTMSLLDGGLLRSIHRGTIEHHCPGCNAVHEINVHAINHDGKRLGWDGDTFRPTIAETVRHETPNGRCEYELRAGVLYFAPGCWHSLAGQSRHLEEFPR